MELELWKVVETYKGLYEISNKGRLKSLHKGKEHFMKPTITNDGYSKTMLSKNGKPKTHTIHRLVALAFIPNPLNLPLVNHKDTVKSNNWVDNLEWETVAGNTTHMHRARKLLKPKCPHCNRPY